MRLVVGMFRRTKPDQVFGLEVNQVRKHCGPIVQNAGWYNWKTQLVGYGDLSIPDIKRIAENLSVGESLYVLHESDWRNKGESNVLFNYFDYTDPGMDHIQACGVLRITRAQVLIMSDYWTSDGMPQHLSQELGDKVEVVLAVR